MDQERQARQLEAYKILLESVEKSVETYCCAVPAANSDSVRDVSSLTNWVKLAKLRVLSSNQVLAPRDSVLPASATSNSRKNDGVVNGRTQDAQHAQQSATQNEIDEGTADSSSESEGEMGDGNLSSAGTEDSMAVMDELLNNMEANGRPLLSVFNDGFFDDNEAPLNNVAIREPAVLLRAASHASSSESLQSVAADPEQDWDTMYMHLQRALIEYNGIDALEEAVAKFSADETKVTVKMLLLEKVVRWSNAQREQKKAKNLTTREEGKLDYLRQRKIWSWEPRSPKKKKGRPSRPSTPTEEAPLEALHPSPQATTAPNSPQSVIEGASAGQHEKKIIYATPAAAKKGKKAAKKAAKKGNGVKGRPPRPTGDDKAWYDCYDLLVEYGEQHGHCNVPMDHEVKTADGRTLPLGMWLYGQGLQIEELAENSPVWYEALSKLFYTGMLSFEVINAGGSAGATSSAAGLSSASTVVPNSSAQTQPPTGPFSAPVTSSLATPATQPSTLPPSPAFGPPPTTSTAPPRGILKRPKSPCSEGPDAAITESGSSRPKTPVSLHPDALASTKASTAAASNNEQPAPSKAVKRKIITSSDEDLVILPAKRASTDLQPQSSQLDHRAGHGHKTSSDSHKRSSDDGIAHHSQTSSSAVHTLSLKNKKLFNTGGDTPMPILLSTMLMEMEVSLPLPALSSGCRTPGKSILKKATTPPSAVSAPTNHYTASPSLLLSATAPHTAGLQVAAKPKDPAHAHSSQMSTTAPAPVSKPPVSSDGRTQATIPTKATDPRVAVAQSCSSQSAVAAPSSALTVAPKVPPVSSPVPSEDRYVAVLYTSDGVDETQLTLEDVHFAIAKEVRGSAAVHKDSILPDALVTLVLLKPQDPQNVFASRFLQDTTVVSTPRDCLQVRNLKLDLGTFCMWFTLLLNEFTLSCWR